MSTAHLYLTRQYGLGVVYLILPPLATCRGTSLARKRTPLGPYRRPIQGVPGGSKGGGCFLMGEVPLYGQM